MKNICLILEYDGTNLNGFQKQPDENLITVQGELEKAISQITGKETGIYGAGRTDAGVSAEEQYVNFFTDANIPPEKYKLALNTKLPPEISVRDSFLVPDKFNARYSAIRRSYKYRILNSPTRSALRRNSVFHYGQKLDFSLMEEAWLSLRGKYNFSAFCRSDTDRKIMTCEIFDTKCWRDNDELVFTVTSDTFLRGMVRFLIGTTILIGVKKLLPDDLMDIVRSCDRKRVVFSAGGVGLSLMKIEYPPEVFVLND